MHNVDERAPKYQLLNMELEKIQRLTSSIIETRLQKFIEAAFEKKNISKALLPDEESELYEKILEVSERYQNLKNKILEGQNVEPKLETCLGSEKILVRFMVKIPMVVGVDMKNYGPFDLEDVATLPRENAEALILQKAAAKIDVKD